LHEIINKKTLSTVQEHKENCYVKRSLQVKHAFRALMLYLMHSDLAHSRFTKAWENCITLRKFSQRESSSQCLCIITGKE